jgi:hypothetical protein
MPELNTEDWSCRVVEPYLDKHGPSPQDALPVSNLSEARERGVELFSPHRGPSGTEPIVGVAYLPTHRPETVVQAWIETNREALEDLSRSSVTRRIGQQYDEHWVSMWQTCAKQADLEAHQTAPDNPAKDPERRCPTCGGSVAARRFVKHVRECS